MSQEPQSYAALPLQLTCIAVNRCREIPEARARMLQAIEHCDELIGGSKQFVATFSGDTVRLVVLPEYFLTSFPMGESVAAWQEKACISEEGPEYEALGRIASERGVYISGNAYELDNYFPELYFQTSFINNDSGELMRR